MITAARYIFIESALTPPTIHAQTSNMEMEIMRHVPNCCMRLAKAERAPVAPAAHQPSVPTRGDGKKGKTPPRSQRMGPTSSPKCKELSQAHSLQFISVHL